MLVGFSNASIAKGLQKFPKARHTVHIAGEPACCMPACRLAGVHNSTAAASLTLDGRTLDRSRAERLQVKRYPNGRFFVQHVPPPGTSARHGSTPGTVRSVRCRRPAQQLPWRLLIMMGQHEAIALIQIESNRRREVLHQFREQAN
jgi:hypothetical protein